MKKCVFTILDKTLVAMSIALMIIGIGFVINQLVTPESQELFLMGSGLWTVGLFQS